MYRPKDHSSRLLFPELFPFGGKLDAGNRWLRIAEIIPWQDLEDEYRKAFSDIGRPGKDAQLVIGLLLLKHMTGLSDICGCRPEVRDARESQDDGRARYPDIFQTTGSKIKRDPENRSVVQGEAEREESDRRSVREREGTLRTEPGEIYGPRGLGDVGAGRASGDEPEDGTAESIERKPVRVREDLTGSHVGSQDDQSAVEDKIGFFSRP